MEFELLAKTFMGLEPVLAQELTQLGANNVQIGRRMVSFTGDKEMMYRANFQLHTAIRILKPIKHFKARSAEDVYAEVQKIDWSQYILEGKTFSVDTVVYSDDFGHTWVPLGGADARPAPQGDEAKIEELPDGRVLLSCRRSGQDGRWFNIFTYADRQCQDGSWAEPVASEKHDGGTATINNNCNGEILFIPALDADGRRVYVALQSVPRGSPCDHRTNLERRSNVSIYWKAFDTAY